MRLTRERGPVAARRLVEAAYQQATGRFAPFSQIAAELYDDHPTSERVRAELKARYGVIVCKKTASEWINRGLESRRATLREAQAAA